MGHELQQGYSIIKSNSKEPAKAWKPATKKLLYTSKTPAKWDVKTRNASNHRDGSNSRNSRKNRETDNSKVVISN